MQGQAGQGSRQADLAEDAAVMLIAGVVDGVTCKDPFQPSLFHDIVDGSILKSCELNTKSVFVVAEREALSSSSYLSF